MSTTNISLIIVVTNTTVFAQFDFLISFLISSGHS